MIIEWNGGECPVAPDTLVKVWLRWGLIKTSAAEKFRWSRDDHPEDIVFYEILPTVNEEE